MVNKCTVPGCTTNHIGGINGTVFELPNDEAQRTKWISFLKIDITTYKHVFVCYKHFAKHFVKKNEQRYRLVKSLQPYPTILPKSQVDINISEAERESANSKTPRKPPKVRNIQEDELEQFKEMDAIRSLEDINEECVCSLGKEFHLLKKEGYVVIYKMDTSSSNVPEITYSVRVSEDLRVQLFHKNAPIPLPTWFWKGRNTFLTSKAMIVNFFSYMTHELLTAEKSEEQHGILEEMNRLKCQKSPCYSYNLILYALELRYTSVHAYKLLRQEMRLPSLSFLRNLVSGKIDPMATATLLRNKGCISSDVVLMFDEIYLQKCEEYFGGETFGADEEGNLYKGMMNFMIVGIDKNVPYVMQMVPENRIDASWLKEEIIRCIENLQSAGFNVRACVCDNHPSNVSTYRKLLSEYSKDNNDLCIYINDKQTYLFHDSVHIIKNIRNNLLSRKRFIFPPFSSDALKDLQVDVEGGEVTWALLHDVYEKDKQCQANLRAAPKITASVLHPGNCKQSVPVALAVFDPSTIAAIRNYFPDKEDSAGFLHLIYVWWTISNSKVRFNSRDKLGNAAIENDGKPEFLRSFADWVEEWQNQKLRNTEKFTLSS